MTDTRDRINAALDLAAGGAIEDACERLWPLVRDAEGREEALFTMACCYERVGQLPPAGYLFTWVAERHPDFAPARERLDRCQRQMAERGLHEDFSDSGHIGCASCLLRYRAELPSCPYCGGPAASVATAVVPASVELQSEGDATSEIARDLDRVWRRIQDRFHDFTVRDDLTGAAKRVQELAREAKARAQSFAESERSREVTKSVAELTSTAAKRVSEFVKREPIQRLARQSKELGEEAYARAKAVATSDDVKEATGRVQNLTAEAAQRVESWSKRGEVRSTWRKIFDGAERMVAEIQKRIDKLTGRNDGNTPENTPNVGEPKQ